MKLEFSTDGRELIIRIPIRVIETAAESDPHKLVDTAFTRREREVLLGILQSKSHKQIATELCVSESAVKFHAGNIYAKTGLRRSQLFRSYGGLQ